jgi:hypothetical protein
MEVDVSWLEVDATQPPDKKGPPPLPGADGGPPPLRARRDTTEVQLDWLEEVPESPVVVMNEPPLIQAKPKGKLPPPLPREEKNPTRPPPRPAPRRSRPPPR